MQLTWLRDQSKSAIHRRRARERALKLWRLIWSAFAVLGILGLILFLGLAFGDWRDFVARLQAGTLVNLAIWLGLLSIIFLARDYVNSWQDTMPLPLVLAELRQRVQKRPRNLSDLFDRKALRVVDSSFLRDKLWRPWRLLESLLHGREIKLFFVRLGVAPQGLVERLKARSHLEEISPSASKALFRSVMFKALEIAHANNDRLVHLSDILGALAVVQSSVRDFLIDQGVDEAELLGVNSWLHYQRSLSSRHSHERLTALDRSKYWRNQLWTSTVTPILDSVGRDLTRYALELPPLVNRTREMERLYEIYSSEAAGVLLVGPHGAGKARFIEGLAQKVIKDQVPPYMRDRRMVTVSVARALSLSNPKMPLKNVATQLAREISRSGNIIIVLQDLQSFEAAKTDEAAMLLESFFAETLQSGQVLLLASVDQESLAKLTGPLTSSLTKLTINPLDDESTLKVLEAQVPKLEGEFQVGITYPALKRAIELSGKFMHDQVQPGKALALLTQAIESHVTHKQKGWITDKEVSAFAQSQTGLPVAQIETNESQRLLNLESEISQRYINQVRAVQMVSAAIRRARTELKSEARPIANFLFMGPTGVGKTELARRLADVYFGGQGKMIRLDMTEYQEPQALRNLIGAPLGTGDSTPGHLVEAVRKNPFSVILLDEFEKAHEDILNVFLQVMEDGRLSAPDGEVYDFTNTLIIATSNAGSQLIQDSLSQGQSLESITEELKRVELPKHFRPELLNRFDGIIVFEPLKFYHVVEIAKLLLQNLSDKMAEREINFEVTNQALEDLAKAGFDPTQGARPLRRVIQDRIEDQIAKLLLAKQVRARDKIVLDKDFEMRVEQAEHY